MSAGQDADFGYDRPHGLESATVNAVARIENVPPYDLGFEFLENAGHSLGIVAGRLQTVLEEVAHHHCLGIVDRGVARHLVGDRVGGPQLWLDEAEHFLFQFGIVHLDQVARLLGGLFGKTDDGLDHRLEMPMTEHDGAQHHFLGKLLRLGFNHEHRVLGAGDHEVEAALRHFVDLRIEHVFVVDEADPGGAHRTHERDAGKRQGGGRRHHGQDVGTAFLIVRHARHDHLCVAAPAAGEQRPDRTVDQPRDQGLVFGRTSFALEVAARNTAGRKVFFLIIAGERQEIDAFLRLLRRYDRRQNGGLAIAGEYRTVGLPGYLAGFENELAPAPIEFLAMDIKHCFWLLS